MKTSTWAAFGIAALAFAAPAAAEAKSFTTDAFSIELGPTPVCFAVPASLHDAAACRGLPPLGAGDIDTSQIGLIAAGGIRRSTGASAAARAGEMPLIGLVQMFRVPAALAYEPDAPYAERVAVEATKAILADLPSEARRGRPVSRVENIDGLVVVRTSVEVDGLAPGTRASFFAHIETATVFGREATYTVVWSGPQAGSAALAHLADDATKTMRLVPGERPAARDASTGSSGRVTKSLLLAAAFALSCALFALIRRGRGRSARLRAELWPTE
jgi:hypothetical protein